MTRLARLLLAVTVLAVLGGFAETPAPKDERDPKAVGHAQKELEAMGGKSWESARFFRFDFVVELPDRKVGPFAHYWDRYTGRYRVDTPGEKGYQAWFNVNNAKDASQAVLMR